ncbi:hypothetical protein ACVBEH_15395, partial [Roseateles sp. GG27B]
KSTPQQYSPALPAAQLVVEGRSAEVLASKAADAPAVAKAAVLVNTRDAEKAVAKPSRNASSERHKARTSAPLEPKLRMEIAEVLSASMPQASMSGNTSVLDPSLQLLQRVEAELAQLRQSSGRLEAQMLALKSQQAVAQPTQSPDPLAVGVGFVLIGLLGASFYLWRIQRAGLAVDESSWRGEIQGDVSIHRKTTLQPLFSVAAGEHQLNVSPSGATDLAEVSAARARPKQEELTLELSTQTESESYSAREPDVKPATESGQQSLDTEDAIDSSPADAFVHDSGHQALSVQFVDSSLHAAPPALPSERHESKVGLEGRHAQIAIEDLIDLEQQVEFFLVLGQDDAAEELLLVRVSAGLTSALPYLKLLEIYQRLGREPAFESMAARFAVHFKASPPTWGVDLNLGCSLESYPEVLQDLQEAWMNHSNAMAKVQALLSEGAEQFTGFDLPAYLDLLLLYSLARDLSEHEVPCEKIDLFLPLDVDAASPNGQSVLATMSSQGPTSAFGTAVELDICLDDVAPGKR